jgi:hypothetical protein
MERKQAWNETLLCVNNLNILSKCKQKKQVSIFFPLFSANNQFLFSFFRNILLVYDSYTGGFIATFAYINILYSGLVHLLHYSLFLYHSPSENNFSRFQCSIFIQVEKIHPPYSPSFTLFIYPPPLTSALLLTYPLNIPILYCLSVWALFNRDLITVFKLVANF